jgi:hypothetical protein
MSHFASTWSSEIRSIRAAIVPTRRAQPHRPAIERLAEMRSLLEDAMLQQLSRRRVARLAADRHGRGENGLGPSLASHAFTQYGGYRSCVPLSCLAPIVGNGAEDRSSAAP